MVTHATTRTDDYAWLRCKDDNDVIAYLEAENVYANAVMAPTQGLQGQLYDEMLSHIKQTDLSVPYRKGAYWYYARTEEGKQYPIFARKRGGADAPDLDAPEELTLDLNTLAQGHAFLGLGAYEVSDDGNLLAYATDTTGYRQYALHVKDLRRSEILPDCLERVTSVVWANDNRTLLLTTEDAVSKRHDTLWRYALGSHQPTPVFNETDERYDIDVARTNDGQYIVLSCYSKATTEVRTVRANKPDGELVILAPRSDDHRYNVEHHGRLFYIVTNRGAVDNRIVVAPDDAPHELNWREIVPEREGIHLKHIDMFEHHGVVRERRGGFENLEILDLHTHRLRPVALDDPVHALGAEPNPEFHTARYRYSYSSLVTPKTVYELELDTGAQTPLKATEVPNYDPGLYATELLHAPAPDGTMIPISLVHRRDTPRDGTAALLLYAYGSYGVSIDPAFSPARLVLLDRGMTYAIAHVRGGGALGERWRTAGHLQRKITTFTDFIACAQHLVDQRYTSAPRLAIQGGSAGGLLVGAVVNMRPDLFGAAVAQVPFVDVVNTMLDASLPLTTAEYLEWGDPNVPADFDYMLQYSPYDNVRAQAYPAMLVKVSINDSQVPYWEGAKFIARLRDAGLGQKPLLLVTNFGAGHGGASGRYDYLREVAQTDAFILAAVTQSAG
ncbi:MAG: S9 family peptidase [Candidatus Eremiobacteraeota bacterium]|nr:S9 family peptidase [Candidatus Eremiobacteraeota bacterium]MBC5821448.1 S9 family peptidase [Candidatus Eremiobacteraeota bacterium]